MLKFEETREHFLGQVCEVLVTLSIEGELVSPGSCLSMVLNVKQLPVQYFNDRLVVFELLHYYRGTYLLGKHYLMPDMLRVIS